MNEIPDNNDLNTSVSFFKKEVEEFVEKRNWTKYHTPKNLIQALTIEASELSQCLLFKDYSVDKILKDDTLKTQISDEVADVFIYLISLINVLNIDLTSSFSNKMEKNKKKYSVKEFKNGIYYKK